jgi:hypothetical protein
MMSETPEAPPLSLLGGPLHRLACRLGLVRHGTNTAALGLAIGLFLWVVMIALAFIGGVGRSVFTLTLIGAHVRLLLVIPLIFVCESVVDPRMTAFAGSLVGRGIVPESQVAALNSVIARICRWKDSWLLEALCLVAAVLMSFGAVAGPYWKHGRRRTRPVLQRRVGYCGTGRCDGISLLFGALWIPVVYFWRVSRRLPPARTPDCAGGLGGLRQADAFRTADPGFAMLRSAQFRKPLGNNGLRGIYPGISVVLAGRDLSSTAAELLSSDELNKGWVLLGWRTLCRSVDRAAGVEGASDGYWVHRPAEPG